MTRPGAERRDGHAQVLQTMRSVRSCARSATASGTYATALPIGVLPVSLLTRSPACDDRAILEVASAFAGSSPTVRNRKSPPAQSANRLDRRPRSTQACPAEIPRSVSMLLWHRGLFESGRLPAHVSCRRPALPGEESCGAACDRHAKNYRRCSGDQHTVTGTS